MHLLLVGGKLVALESPVGPVVFVDLIKVCILPLSFLSLHFITQFCGKYQPVFGCIIYVASVIGFLSYLVRLYVSIPMDTLRWFSKVWLNRRTVFLSVSSSLYFYLLIRYLN